MRKLLIFITILLVPKICFAQMHETRWLPDTCNGCVVVYEWDDAVPQDQRQTTFKRIEKGDDSYKGLDDATQFQKIVNDNRIKNKAVNIISDKRPDISPVDVKWNYDSQKVLHVNDSRLTSSDKTKIASEFQKDSNLENVSLD